MGSEPFHDFSQQIIYSFADEETCGKKKTSVSRPFSEVSSPVRILFSCEEFRAGQRIEKAGHRMIIIVKLALKPCKSIVALSGGPLRARKIL